MLNPIEARQTSTDDQELEREVRLRLHREDRSYYAAVVNYKIAISDGNLTLTGHVRSRQVARGMTDVSRRVRGILAVDDQLVADDELEQRAVAAIKGGGIEGLTRLNVQAEFGYLRVGGTFTSTGGRDEALRIAAEVPGATGVASLHAMDVIPN